MLFEPTVRRVLVIDDNRDAADSLQDILLLGGHRVDVAYDGLDGVEKARQLKPDVLICDIGLPGMDGYQVARAFRADAGLQSTFLVALSGYAQPEDLRRAYAAGFDVHIAKPASVERIEETLTLSKRSNKGDNSKLPGSCSSERRTEKDLPSILGY
jgi:two-component system CheB/CheR fusion protein